MVNYYIIQINRTKDRTLVFIIIAIIASRCMRYASDEWLENQNKL